ncbi:oxygen-independent coproporphyrinogen III oxidase [Pseudoalteromonas tunicata]|uniref:Coproporphyrinogen-III oxidase n=1 Tax=Pseudoalteromonas tunicata D2 TaxID=87626 RepID=A4CEN9_9GAMM|nr:oxygen-independent coproporphyrinogen III oxidase [Pseudoalteromonas tunicata]ATC96032.1 oxygen-independent coproporphyrinogen III oxidase [Pseudoalteromonas tunicata]AXT31561.1 oxygen-independent coproporphyrinogen III oxidase [Pseudoalteromonas tunicata]EAR26768.1 coproporphyrinogen III oxidase [Pseudoalteromonas tunicata D2]
MQNTIDWDDSLIKKYNVSGPRYTSYPTALSFNDGFSKQDMLSALAQTNNKKLSLYIHIPFCHQLCYYCGCNKIVTRHQHKADLYLDYLEQEITAQAKLYQHYEVEQLHLGGGTPTFLDQAQMTRLINMLNQHFQFKADAQKGIEIDPRSLAENMLSVLFQLGFNRVSFGIQDFNDDVQKAVNREQCAENVANLVIEARQLGFKSVNADMIYGLPLQTPESFAATIDQLISLSPDRVSVFNYAHLPDRFAAQRKIKDQDLPCATDKLAMFKNTLAQMTAAGYVLIGMDHFAKKDDSLAIAQQQGLLHRNFQGYTTHGDCDLLGLGVSSISQVGNSIFQNPKELKGYYQAVETSGIAVCKGLTLNDDDCLRADVIRQLICHFTLDIPTIERQYGINFKVYFASALVQLQTLAADNMLSVEPKTITVTAKGRLFIRIICMAFDAYLQRQAKLTRFSQVI